jgi:glycosyltransferase involved in cell wall biosynthesis
MTETQKHFGECGQNPKVRHPGIHNDFRPEKQNEDNAVLETYGLEPGYVLAVGNGMPHKNLGVILEIAPQLDRPIIFAGVSDKNRRYWESRHSGATAKWIGHVEQHDLPPLLRGAFCLVQPSLIEGYGYPPLEAIACGVPAVVSDIPVLVETTGGNALTADPRNPKTWLESLDALINETAYRGQIRKGLKWVEPLRGQNAWEPYMFDIRNLFEMS